MIHESDSNDLIFDVNDWQNKIKNAQSLLDKITNNNNLSNIPLDIIKEEITNTLSPIDQLTKSKYWETIQSYMSNLIENADKIKELLKILNELRPYLEFELKKEKYSKQSITDLLNSDNKNSNDLLRQLLSSVKSSYLKDRLPKSIFKKTQILEYPLDKINNKIWKLIEEDNNKIIKFAMENKKDKKLGKQIDCIYTINFDDLSDDITITKKLLPFDKRVYISASALFNAGNNIITLTQIYYAMGCTGKPGANSIKRINESISKMMGAKIYVNNSDESKTYKYKKFIYDGALLPAERISSIVNGQLSNSSIHLFREPPIVSFAKQRNQITTISIEMLQSPVSKTDNNLLIEDYLIERISKAKNNSKLHKILFKTFYEHIIIPDDSSEQKKHMKKRLPKKVQIYLDYYIKCNYIKSYNINSNGVTIHFK